MKNVKTLKHLLAIMMILSIVVGMIPANTFANDGGEEHVAYITNDEPAEDSTEAETSAPAPAEEPAPAETPAETPAEAPAEAESVTSAGTEGETSTEAEDEAKDEAPAETEAEVETEAPAETGKRPVKKPAAMESEEKTTLAADEGKAALTADDNEIAPTSDETPVGGSNFVSGGAIGNNVSSWSVEYTDGKIILKLSGSVDENGAQIGFGMSDGGGALVCSNIWSGYNWSFATYWGLNGLTWEVTGEPTNYTATITLPYADTFTLTFANTTVKYVDGYVDSVDTQEDQNQGQDQNQGPIPKYLEPNETYQAQNSISPAFDFHVFAVHLETTTHMNGNIAVDYLDNAQGFGRATEGQINYIGKDVTFSTTLNVQTILDNGRYNDFIIESGVKCVDVNSVKRLKIGNGPGQIEENPAKYVYQAT